MNRKCHYTQHYKKIKRKRFVLFCVRYECYNMTYYSAKIINMTVNYVPVGNDYE